MTAPVRSPLWLTYGITFFLAACSLLYELLIAQTLSLLAGNMVTWYSITVGVFLASMGIGAFVLDARYREGRAWVALFQVEMLLCLVGALAVIVVHFAHILHGYLAVQEHHDLGIAVFFAFTFLMVFLVGFLSGIELPLLIRLANEISGETRVTNRILGADYIGALAAGVLFPIVLVPHLELFTIGFLTAIANLVVAILILVMFLGEKEKVLLKSALSGALLVALLGGMLNLSRIEQFFLKRYYYFIEASQTFPDLFASLERFPHVFRASSPYQKIDIVHDVMGYPSDVLIDAYSTKFIEDPNQPKDQVLFLNGDVQVLSDYEEIYHEPFAHVPILLNGRVPENVLVLGAGDGLLVRELIKYDQIRSILQVDLDPKLIELAREHPILTAMNGRSMEDPRLEVRLGDAFQYLRTTPGTYDAIYLDFPVPIDYNLSKLYSREFFHFVREHLEEDGYAVLDSPGTGMFDMPDENGKQQIDPENDWDNYYHTIKMAGFETIRPFVSTLESDNPRAYQILARTGLDLEDRTEEQRRLPRRVLMQAYLIENSVSLQQGFIAMWRNPKQLELRYQDFGIKLHFLNEQRFHLSLVPEFPMPREVDLTKVNSIMRPTFPNISVWHVRIPW